MKVAPEEIDPICTSQEEEENSQRSDVQTPPRTSSDLMHTRNNEVPVKPEKPKKKIKGLGFLSGTLKFGGSHLGGLMDVMGVTDVFDKSINMAAAEMALMSESEKLQAQKGLWKKQRRYDLLQLASAMAGTVLGCTEAWLFYAQVAVVFSDGEIGYSGEPEASHLLVMRLFCSIFALTASNFFGFFLMAI